MRGLVAAGMIVTIMVLACLHMLGPHPVSNDPQPIDIAPVEEEAQIAAKPVDRVDPLKEDNESAEEAAALSLAPDLSSPPITRLASTPDPPSDVVRGMLVDAETGLPIAGAHVQLLAFRRRSEGRYSTIDDQSELVRTSNLGTFEIGGLAPGEYEVYLWHEHYHEYGQRSIEIAGSTDLEPWELRPYGSIEATISTPEGDVAVGANLNAQPLRRHQPRIGGRPPHVESRTVIGSPSRGRAQELDEPAARFRLPAGEYTVIAKSQEHTSSEPRRVVVEAGRATTCHLQLRPPARIRLTLRGVTPSTESVVDIDRRGGFSIRDIRGKGPHLDSGPIPADTYFLSFRGYARTVELEPGEVIDMTLGEESDARLLSGRVIDADGHGIEGANVRLFRTFSPAKGSTTRETAAEGTSSEDGSFVLETRGGGDLAVRAWKKGYTQRMVEPKTGPVIVRLEALASLRGRVVKPDGEGIAGAAVSRAPLDSPFIRPDEKVITDEQGLFELEGLEPGWFEIHVSSTGSHAGKTMEVLCRPGQVIDDLVIELELGGSIEGLLTSADGTPCVEARVVVQPEDADSSSRQSSLTDHRGHYRINGLRAGEWRVWSHSGLYTAPNQEEVRVHSGEITRVDLELPLQLTLHGRVIRQEGRDLENLTVMITPPGEHWFPPTITTDHRGEFVFPGLEAERYEIEIVEQWDPGVPGLSAKGILVAAASVELSPDVPHPEISLEERAGSVALTGQVTMDGKPAAGFLVEWAEVGEDRRWRPAGVITDASGHYLLQVEPGPAHLLITRPRSEDSFHRIELVVPSDAAHRHDIELPNSGLRGRLERSRVEAADFLYRGPSSAGDWQRGEVEDHELEIAFLPPGAYELAIRSDRGIAHFPNLRVEQGEWLDLGDVDLEPLAVREVRLQDEESRPVDVRGVEIDFFGAYPRVFAQPEDSLGSLEIRGLPGEYPIGLELPGYRPHRVAIELTAVESEPMVIRLQKR